MEGEIDAYAYASIGRFGDEVDRDIVGELTSAPGNARVVKTLTRSGIERRMLTKALSGEI